MVGVCGTIGTTAEGNDAVIDELEWTGDETTITTERADSTITVTQHDTLAESQPLEASDGSLFWLWGQLYGINAGEYPPKRITHPSIPDLDYLVEQFDRYDEEVFSRLNGEFFIIRETPEGEYQFVTNRLGTRPVYYYQPEDGGLVISARVQTFPLFAAVETDWNLDYLYEYLSFRRAFGRRTPLEGVHLFYPGAITTYDPDTAELSIERYWWPTFEPTDEPYSRFRTAFATALNDAVADRAAQTDDNGLLLSGGTDSRSILAAVEDQSNLQCYHATAWTGSTETKTSKRVARTAGAPLHILKRTPEYLVDAIERNPPLSNFQSWFNQAHMTGFLDELRESDAIFTGQYGEIYMGGYIPQKKVTIPGLSTLALPVEKRTETIDDYVERMTDGSSVKHSTRHPEYLPRPPAAKHVLRENIERQHDGSINHHGITYPSINEIIYCPYYPMTNLHTFFFYESLVQMMPTYNPFFDNRLIDLVLRMSIPMQINHDPVADSVNTHHRSLANIAHAGEGIPLSWPPTARYVGHKLYWLKRELADDSEDVYTQNTSWTTDHDEFLRQHPVVREQINRHSDQIEQVEWLDLDGVEACYETHKNGTNRRSELYCLLTILNSPVFSRLHPPADEA